MKLGSPRRFVYMLVVVRVPSSRRPWLTVSGGRQEAWASKGTVVSVLAPSAPNLARGRTTFAARPQNHEQKLTGKMYRGALRSICRADFFFFFFFSRPFGKPVFFFFFWFKVLKTFFSYGATKDKALVGICYRI